MRKTNQELVNKHVEQMQNMQNIIEYNAVSLYWKMMEQDMLRVK